MAPSNKVAVMRLCRQKRDAAVFKKSILTCLITEEQSCLCGEPFCYGGGGVFPRQRLVQRPVYEDDCCLPAAEQIFDQISSEAWSLFLITVDKPASCRGKVD